MTLKMMLETGDEHAGQAYRNVDAGQCPGCPSNLATKLVMQIVFQVCSRNGAEPIIFGQGCGIGRDILQRSAIGTLDSACVGLLQAMAVRGIDRPVVIIDGDGQVDMGFDDFSGAFQQRHPYLHVVCDNQGFSASGTHATGMTDLLARVSTRPDGRQGKPNGRLVTRKHPAVMIKFSGARYTATASTSHLPDFIEKIERGLRETPSFVHLFTPCNVSWGYDDSAAASVTKLGVTSGMWPLWEWGDDGFRRTLPFQRRSFQKRLREYLKSQRRYAHLTEEEYVEVEQYARELNEMVDRLEKGFGVSPGNSPVAELAASEQDGAPA